MGQLTIVSRLPESTSEPTLRPQASCSSAGARFELKRAALFRRDALVEDAPEMHQGGIRPDRQKRRVRIVVQIAIVDHGGARLLVRPRGSLRDLPLGGVYFSEYSTMIVK